MDIAIHGGRVRDLLRAGQFAQRPGVPLFGRTQLQRCAAGQRGAVQTADPNPGHQLERRVEGAQIQVERAVQEAGERGQADERPGEGRALVR